MTQNKLTFTYQDLAIEIIDEPTYHTGSPDNTLSYDKQYLGAEAHQYTSSTHAISVRQGNQILSSCVVIGSGSATTIHENSTIHDNDHLLLCCGNTVFCLLLPHLDLQWQIHADPITCFQLFRLQDDYIVHGEMQITRIDKQGNIAWEFGGADIFVSVEGKQEIQIGHDRIVLTDFSNRIYTIDFYGKTIDT
ncbi:hypothetical protein [Sphingobacterium sp. LRF_L2]|uniref:hypothetical protein n=1 Tax=Sphingobacterium sp. LRF_L2 TaxID=3369421 RepID=UPI003F61FCA5